MLKDAIEKIKDEKDLIVFFTDSYDVILYQTASQIVKKFKKFNARVVFGAEYFCAPNERMAEKFPNVEENDKKFLNSGGFIGYVHDIYLILSHIVDDLKMPAADTKNECIYLPDDEKLIGFYDINVQSRGVHCTPVGN